jgi:nitroreductase
MKSDIETIKIRHSVRNYSDTTIEKEKLEQISEFIDSNQRGPLGSQLRFRIVDGSAYSQEELKALGTYRSVKGARLYIAGAVKRNPYAMEDYGYCMEKNVLLATRLGLGTCWLAGLNHSTFGEILELSENEVIPAVTPFGYAAEQNTMFEKAVIAVAGSKKRKEFNELFFNDSLDEPLNLTEDSNWSTVFECVRWAPSASNKLFS